MLIMGLVYNRSSLAHKWTKETTVWSYLYNYSFSWTNTETYTDTMLVGALVYITDK